MPLLIPLSGSKAEFPAPTQQLAPNVPSLCCKPVLKPRRQPLLEEEEISMESDSFTIKILDSVCLTFCNVESILTYCHSTTSCHGQRKRYYPCVTDEKTEARQGDMPLSKWHNN